MDTTQIEFLNKISSAIRASQGRDELLTMIENFILQICPDCYISIIIKDNMNIFKIIRSNALPPEEIERFQIDSTHVLMERVKSEKKAILFENSENEDALSGLLVGKTKGALLILPLIWANEYIGAIVLNKQKFDKNEIILFEAVSNLTSTSLYCCILEDKIQQMSITDNIMETYTREFFINKFFSELEIAKALNYSLTIFLIKIDNFRKYNEKYGFARGDMKLKEISRIFKNIDEKNFIVGRYAPITFSLLAKEMTLIDAQVLAGKLRKIFETIAYEEDKEVPLTLSIGISSFPEHGDDETYLLQSAEKALSEAIAGGGNKIKVFKS